MRITPTPMLEAVEKFAESNTAAGMSKGTLALQRSHGRKLESAVKEWLKARDRWQPMMASEADAQLVTFFFARCKGGDGHRSNMQSYLRTFLKFCERNDWLAAGATDKLMHGRKAKPFSRKPKHYIAPEDFPVMLECQTRHPTDRVTMALLLWTLCRRSELNGLLWKHVDMEARTMNVYRPKSRRWTPVTICPDLYDELEAYQFWYMEEIGGSLDPEWHVLPELIPHRVFDFEKGHYGHGTTYSINPERHPMHMERIIKRGLDALGVTTTENGKTVNHVGEGAHTIRRSGARAMLKYLSASTGFADALDTVRAMLDHRDTKMTLLYIGMEKTADELNQWLKTNSPYGSPARARAYQHH